MSIRNVANPFQDDIARLEVDLQCELMKKPAITEESIEMESQIWSRLPQDLLMRILALLSTLTSRKFRAVSKSWSFLLSPALTFRNISFTTVPSSSPAFLYGSVLHSTVNSMADKDLYLLQPLPGGSRMFKLSLDFLFGNLSFGKIVISCKGLLCCCYPTSWEVHTTSLYICNPVTRTWKTLPSPNQLTRWDFIGLAFDNLTRRCILIIGTNSIDEEGNNMVMEIYDSETQGWTQDTQLEMDKGEALICPIGKGVYSRGRFYWISKTKDRSFRDNVDVVGFDVGKRRWDVIKNPATRSDGFDCNWQLTGHDGKVVLVNSNDLCLWRLDEDEGRWVELQALPGSLCLEAVIRWENGKMSSSSRRAGCSGPGYYPPKVVVNSFGWVLVHLYKNRLVVFDAEGKFVDNIKGRKRSILELSYPRAYDYEINNVWWP